MICGNATFSNDSFGHFVSVDTLTMSSSTKKKIM